MNIPDALAERLLEDIIPLMRIDHDQRDYCGFCHGPYSFKTHEIEHKQSCSAQEFIKLYYAPGKEN